tara:strand:+ start:7263 stop:8621 length:1359 start_codon:yes stop_codon:yes gene_type:complete
MIAILGAGISGLAVAHQLQKDGKSFVILEQDENAGGKIQTVKIKDFLCELGPNTVLINNKETKEVLEDLNLYKSLIFPEEIAVKQRFVLKNNKIEPIPTSFKRAISSNLIGLNTIFRILKEPFISKKKNQSEESLADFCRRRFGTQIFEDLIVPFITGIYAGDPEKMSINHTLSILKDAEELHGSVVKGMIQLMKEKKKKNSEDQLPKQKIFSLPEGLINLIQAFENELQEKLHLNAKVISIEQKVDSYLITYSQNSEEKTIQVDQVISTLPAPVLSKLISPLSQSFANALDNLNYVSAVSLHLSVRKSQLDFKEAAFGILSRRSEKVPFLGILFNSRFFPHTSSDPEKELITVIAGGSRYPELVNKPDDEIENELISSLQKVLGSKEKPELLSIKKWFNGIPQYEIGYHNFLDSMNEFRSYHPNFFIAGNFNNGISVSDCIRNGINLAKNS